MQTFVSFFVFSSLFIKRSNYMCISVSSYVINECKKMTFSGAKLFFLCKSALGTPVPCLKIGKGAPCSIIVGAHHGMEHITSRLSLRFAREILNDECLKAHRTVFVVPMLNPDGCDIAASAADKKSTPCKRPLCAFGNGDLPLWQANANGVDLNHNYNAGFDKCKMLERSVGVFSPCRSRYGGPYPESEPETKSLSTLTRLLSKRLRVAVALHTQGEEIYYSYMDKIPPHAKELAENFAKVSGYTLSKPDLAASHGGYKDYVISRFDIPAFTVECGKGKNPLPDGDLDDISKKVIPILKIAASF